MPGNRIFTPLAAFLLVVFSGLSPFCAASDRQGLPWSLCEDLLNGRSIRFERQATMPAGPLKGRPLSAASPAPPLVTLTDTERMILPEPATDSSWAISNFVTRQGPALAYVPKVAPVSVSIVKEQETDANYHLMIRLVFPADHPVHFWMPSMDGLASEAHTVRDVVIEFGSHSTEEDKGKPFNVWHGIALRYAMQARMGTTWIKIRRIRKEGRTVREFPAQLTETQKLDLLTRFFERAEEVQQGELYHTVVKNCATEVKQIMCTLGGADEGLLTWLWREAISWTPHGVLKVLRLRGFEIDENFREIEIDPDDQL